MWRRLGLFGMGLLIVQGTMGVVGTEAAGVVVGPISEQTVNGDLGTGSGAYSSYQIGGGSTDGVAQPEGARNSPTGPTAEQIPDDQTYTGQEPKVTQEAVRGGYRSSPGTYRGGTRSGVGTTPDGYRTGPRTPSGNVTNRAPVGTGAGPGYGGATAGRFGGFFGGLAAGAFLGHLFNPFGYWGGGYGYGVQGFGTLFSLLLWALLIYLTYRVVKWLFRGRIR